MSAIDSILVGVREDLAARETRVPRKGLEERLAGAPAVRPFAGAIQACPGMAVIAEIKRRSPSRGVLRASLDAAALSAEYARAGGACVSVLTEARAFGGSLSDLEAVRRSSELPVLRKDFVISSYQVLEARVHGADAVLLIASILETPALSSLLDLTLALGMTPLVEAHEAADLERALSAGATLVGINNRDLRTLDVDRTRVATLRPLVPDGIGVVAESGVRGPEDIRPLLDLGIDAVLIGTTLVLAPHPGRKLEEIVAACRGEDLRPDEA